MQKEQFLWDGEWGRGGGGVELYGIGDPSGPIFLHLRLGKTSNIYEEKKF